MSDYSKKIGVISVETDGGAAVNAQIEQADIFVTGPMSSGTRLVCEILEAGGFKVVHDSLHGIVKRTAPVVVAVTREFTATVRSMEKAFNNDERIPVQDSLVGIANNYPYALWISYEQLCEAPDSTIRVLADWLDVEPWQVPVSIVRSENSVPGGSKINKELLRSHV